MPWMPRRYAICCLLTSGWLTSRPTHLEDAQADKEQELRLRSTAPILSETELFGVSRLIDSIPDWPTNKAAVPEWKVATRAIAALRSLSTEDFARGFVLYADLASRHPGPEERLLATARGLLLLMLMFDWASLEDIPGYALLQSMCGEPMLTASSADQVHDPRPVGILGASPIYLCTRKQKLPVVSGLPSLVRAADKAKKLPISRHARGWICNADARPMPMALGRQSSIEDWIRAFCVTRQ